MTPQEIFEYRLRWKPGTCVAVHSDLENRAKTWCNKNVPKHQWTTVEYTDVYEHTYCFESVEAAEKFNIEFQDWITN